MNLARAFSTCKVIGLCCALLLTTATQAQMNLEQTSSSISFMSTKNQNFSEQHTFDQFSGSVNKEGELLITIDMASVNTMIPIRNERMQSMLFKVTDYNEASFTATVDKALTSLKVGETQTAKIDGEMTIVGNTVPVSFHVRVVGLSDGKLSVTTTKPTLLSTTAFGLDDGVAALQKIAGLQGISTAVPLSFSVVFAG